jgi:hypothetical protein
MPISAISEERGVAFYEGELLVKTLNTKEELIPGLSLAA